jgi:hypothetical protein
MVHSNSQTQSALVSAYQHNSKGGFKSPDGGRVTDTSLDDKDIIL